MRTALGLAVAAAILLSGCGGARFAASAPASPQLVYRAEGTPAPGQLERTATLVAARLADIGEPPAAVLVRGGELLLPPATTLLPPAVLAELTSPGRLEFIDWEPNVIGPDGRTAPTKASVTGGTDPGEAGAVPLLEARARVAMRRVRLHHADAIIVQAETANNLPSTSLDRYYVLRNAPALTGADVRKPQAMLDEQSSVPIVQFTLTTDGQARFRALSAAVARRGQLRAHGGAPDFQHLGIVLDGRLVSVPYIDYNAYPDGVDASMGSEIAGGFTPRSAHVLAAVLAHGPLPVALSPAP